MLIGIHKLRRIIRISLVNAIITAVVMFAAAYKFQLLGVLAAFTAGAVLLTPFYARKLLREFEVPVKVFLKKVVLPLVWPMGLAAAALFIIQRVLNGIPSLLVGGIICGAVYLIFFIMVNRQDKILRFKYE